MSTSVFDSTVFWRQLDILSHEKIKEIRPTLIGIGGLGSPTAMVLAKMGVRELTVYDPDIVDIHNVPNQAYSVNDVGSYKVDAIANIVVGYGATLNGIKEVYKDQPLSGLVIVSVDNMASRKDVWEAVKFSPNVPLLIDMRMGAEVGRIFAINPVQRDHIKYYESTLYSDDEAIDLPCTAQAIIYNTFGMASWAGRLVKGFVMDEEIPKETILDMVTFGVYTL